MNKTVAKMKIIDVSVEIPLIKVSKLNLLRFKNTPNIISKNEEV